MADPVPETAPSEPPPPARGGWLAPAVLAVSCLVIGFVGGWFLRGDGGNASVLPPAAERPAATTPRPVTTSAQPQPPPGPARGQVKMVVLNGTETAGLAASTAARAQRLGYVGVGVGNAPPEAGPTVVYFTPGNRPAAAQARRDLGGASVVPIAVGSAIESAAIAALSDAEVVVVLGSG